MGLCGLILHEIIAQSPAPGDEAEQLARFHAAAGIEILDRAAELGEVRADAGILVDRLHRPVEEAVRRARRLVDFLAAHRGELIDLLAEFGRVRVERDQLGDEGVDLLVELALLLLLEGNEARRLLGLDGLQRRGRLEGERRRGCFGSLGLGGHLLSPCNVWLPARLGCRGQERKG